MPTEWLKSLHRKETPKTQSMQKLGYMKDKLTNTLLHTDATEKNTALAARWLKRRCLVMHYGF